MKAFVTIQNFGNVNQRIDLCETIERVTGIPATLGESEVVLFTCELDNLGETFTKLAKDTETHWIEYTVQLEY